MCTTPEKAENDALLSEIEGMTPRHVFGGVPVEEVVGGRRGERSVAPVAEAELEGATGWKGEGEITKEARGRVEEHVRAAHEEGLKLVYHGLPG